MRLERVFLAVSLAGLVVLGACGTRAISGSGTKSGSTAPLALGLTAPFTLGTQNTQPVGTTVLSFQITLTGAVLQPGNVSLISSPQTIELTQLQTDNFLISTSNVGTGNYTSLDLTFANPDMTVFAGAGSFANCTLNTICEFQPTLTVSSITLSPALTLTSGTPAALMLDLSVDDSLQQDLSFDLSAGLTFQQPTITSATSVVFPLNTVAGQITAVGSNQFTLQTAAGQTFTVATNSSTGYSFPTTVCSANDASCLATGQVVSADMNVLGNGSLQATTVIFEDNSGDPVVQGTVASFNLSSNPPEIGLIIHGQVPATAGVDIDNVATVKVQSGANYLIDADILAVPSGLTFASAADWVVGQEVLVRGNTVDVTPVNNEPSTIVITTNQLTLRQAQWTAVVGMAYNSSTSAFSVNTLPSIFGAVTPNPITNFYDYVSTPTQFVNFTDPTQVTAGTDVTVKGLIFSNTTNPVASPSDLISIVQGAPNIAQNALRAGGRGRRTLR